jgi:hypothetical protein
MRRFTSNELFRIRNLIPIGQVIEEILAIPSHSFGEKCRICTS